MEPRPLTAVASTSLLFRVIRVVASILSLVTFAALLLTIWTLAQAGPSALGQFGIESLVVTWPTAIALAVLVFGPVLSVRLATPPYVGLSLLVVWILSAATYAVSDAHARSLTGALALLIWTATPLLPVFTLRTVLALRSRLSRSLQIAITVAIGLVFWWLTAPVALAVSCAVARSCP